MKCTKCGSANIQIIEKKKYKHDYKIPRILCIFLIIVLLITSKYQKIIAGCALLVLIGTLIYVAIKEKQYKRKDIYRCHCKDCGALFNYIR